MITSTANPRVKWVRSLQAKKSARDAERVIVVEGPHLLQEALAAGVQALALFHLETLPVPDQELVNAFVLQGCRREIVAEHVLKAMSDTGTPQRVLAVLPRPEPARPEAPSLALVLDRIADPGNMGTMLRTARAAAVEVVFLLLGVDPYNPKVVRAAAGAHFHLPLIQRSSEALAELGAGLPIWISDAHAGERYDCVDWRPPAALVIGSEAHGHQPRLDKLATGRVRIPMQGQTESLNAAVAAAVILFEINRQRGERCKSER